VAQGYWNDPEKSAERFRPAPGQPEGLVHPELAVWSGDTVRRDAEGFLYFVGRRDEMIKTSGYRVSPTEVEEALYATGLVDEAAVFGLPDPELGQHIAAVVVPADRETFTPDALLADCRQSLPGFMVPARIEIRSALPRNPNGKIDRTALRATLEESEDAA
jgi:acyl-coenzyme A synthetase/AMP-(fatty) acid ligase